MILVLDSSVLNPFARAGRLADLQRLTDGFDHVTTRAVLDELARGVAEYPALAAIPQQPWLRTVASDSLAELVAFSEYVRVLGGSSRNIGESSVLAHAEIHGAVAFVDDDAAVSAGRTRGVTIRRSLAVVTQGVNRQLLDRSEAIALVDDLVRVGGARLPCDGAGFEAWAVKRGLLL
jgi:predicted nucleic acid-binding protein